MLKEDGEISSTSFRKCTPYYYQRIIINQLIRVYQYRPTYKRYIVHVNYYICVLLIYYKLLKDTSTRNNHFRIKRLLPSHVGAFSYNVITIESDYKKLDFISLSKSISKKICNESECRLSLLLHKKFQAKQMI